MYDLRNDFDMKPEDVRSPFDCIDVLFHEFMADDIATVERIYEVAGLPMTNESRAQIQAYLDAHPRGVDGQVVYDLRNDFDTKPEDVRSPFDFYLNQFDVRLEVR